MATLTNNDPKAQPYFDTTSPGFHYSVVVFVLTVLAAWGVDLPQDPAALGHDIVNTFSTGGIYALIGLLVSSLIFPVYNAIRSGIKFSFKSIFSLNSTWIALLNAVASGLALTGFVLPEGTAEQLVYAASVKDWMALGSAFLLTVGNTLLRFIKENKRVTAGT